MSAVMQENKEKVKFMFDNVFRAEDAPVVVNAPRKKHELTDEELDAIRAEARAEGEATGHQRGFAEAQAGIEQQTAQTFAAIGEALSASFAQLEQENREIREFAARLSLLAARKLAARLIAERPQAEIEAVIEECVTHLNREPHLVLRVADGLSGLLKEYVDRLCHERAGALDRRSGSALRRLPCRMGRWRHHPLAFGHRRGIDPDRRPLRPKSERRR